MTAQNRATLKSEFETGDVPDGTDYANLIDSFLNLVETSAQTVNGAITFGGAVTLNSTVTAATANVVGNARVSGTFSAGTVNVTNAVSAGSVNASAATFTILTVGGAPITGGAQGELWLEATAATTVASAGEFNVVKGTTTAEASLLSDFTHATPFRLTYTGSATKVFAVNVNYSITAGGNNKLSSLRIAKNGTTIAKSEIDRFIGTGTDVGAGGLQTLVELTASSFIELYLTNKTDTVSLTVEKANMFISEV